MVHPCVCLIVLFPSSALLSFLLWASQPNCRSVAATVVFAAPQSTLWGKNFRHPPIPWYACPALFCVIVLHIFWIERNMFRWKAICNLALMRGLFYPRRRHTQVFAHIQAPEHHTCTYNMQSIAWVVCSGYEGDTQNLRSAQPITPLYIQPYPSINQAVNRTTKRTADTACNLLLWICVSMLYRWGGDSMRDFLHGENTV